MSSVTEITHPPVSGFKIKPFLSGAGLLQQAAQRLADLRRGNGAFKTMDLVNILLCQAARTRRAAQPPVRLHLRSQSSKGVAAVRLRLS